MALAFGNSSHKELKSSSSIAPSSINIIGLPFFGFVINDAPPSLPNSFNSLGGGLWNFPCK